MRISSPRFLIPGLLLLGACSSGPRVIAAPAPAGALECSLRQATQLGYEPIGGGVSDGYIRFSARNAYTAGAAAKEATARVLTLGLAGSDRPVENRLNVTSASGMIRINVGSVWESGEEKGTIGKPSETAMADAEGILAACGTPSDRTRVGQI